ncbi:acetate kinase, partial [Janthinobacterium sp. hw3]|nr:acetate kinase [Janthinobacterium fluminis]
MQYKHMVGFGAAGAAALLLSAAVHAQQAGTSRADLEERLETMKKQLAEQKQMLETLRQSLGEQQRSIAALRRAAGDEALAGQRGTGAAQAADGAAAPAAEAGA